MSEKETQTNNRSEHRFDTLSLLAGLNESDMESFSLDDILKEFSKPASGQEQSNEKENNRISAETEQAGNTDSDFVSSIQQAIDRELEISMAAPDPVIVIEEETDIVNAKDNQLPEANEPENETESILKRYGFRLVQREESVVPEESSDAFLNEDDEEASEASSTNYAEDKHREKLSVNAGTKSNGHKPAKKTSANKPKAVFQKKKPSVAPTVEIEKNSGNNAEVHESKAPLRLQIREVDSYLPETEDDEEDITQQRKNNIHLLHEAGVPSLDEAIHKAGKEFKQNRSAMTITFLTAVLAIVLTVIYVYGLSEESFVANSQKLSLILLAVMVVSGAASWRSIALGFRELLTLKFTRNVLYIVALFVTAIAAAICKAGDRIPAVALICLDSFFMQWGATLSSLGKRRSLKPLSKEGLVLTAIASVEQAHNNSRAVASAEYQEKSFLENLLTDDFSDSILSAYSAFIIVATLVLSFVAKGQKNYSFIWCWSLLLASAVPLGSFISNTRPFAILALTLNKHDCAIAGWNGAKELYQSRYFILRDEDLFSKKQVKLGGVKLYHALSVGQVASYAAAIMEIAGCGLAPLFMELRNANNGREIPITQFRRYEGGGFGAKAAGDVVLIGSHRFMQLMGIKMDVAGKIPGAVYISINKALAAVFVLNYSVSPKMKRAMHRLRDSGKVQPLAATRDFMLTPKVIEQYFKFPPERLDFPSAEIRSQLADCGKRKNRHSCAVTANSSFTVFINVYLAAIRLYKQIVVSVYLSVLSGFIGTILTFVLIFIPDLPKINAFSATVFAILLSVPILIISGLKKK